MEVILMERIQKLGQMGDVVRVKQGYARNYLLPQGKALRFTSANQKIFASQKIELEARNLELKKEAEELGTILQDREFIVIRSASDTGSLYGSVSKRDVVDAAQQDGLSILRNQVEMSRPIKEIGMHDVSVTLHPEVEISICVNVARSNEEAASISAKKAAKNSTEEDSDNPEFEYKPPPTSEEQH